jgi:hypothetical protein
MRPVCVECRCEMRCEKNDVRVLIRGEIWSGDLWECPHCGRHVVAGFGARPLASEGEPHFAAVFRASSERGELYALIDKAA